MVSSRGNNPNNVMIFAVDLLSLLRLDQFLCDETEADPLAPLLEPSRNFLAVS